MNRITMKQIVVSHAFVGASLAAAAEPLAWPFHDDTLANGMRVITLEDHRTPLVSLQIWFHVGSKDENPERQGFAHMFEHMMFRGTDRIGPQDHFKYLQRVGAEVNGYTSFDMTVYWETVPASQLDLAMWLEAERLANLKINEEYFAAEREVVKEERRMRYLNRPYGRLYETLYRAAFTAMPYRWTPIGNLAHLNAATTDELRTFFQTFYVPNNATLVVVGDVKHEDVLAKARKYFEPIPRRPDPPRPAVQEPVIDQPRRVEITDRAPSPMVVLAYPAPSAKAPEAIPLDILRRILSSGQSSRFYRHLVLEKKIAVSASSYDSLLEQAGLFVLQAVLRPGVSVEQGEQALLDEVKRLLDEGIEPDELEKARNQAVAEYVRTSETVRGKADQLGYATVILGDPNRVMTDLARKRTVTAEEVLAVAREVLKENRRIAVIIRPDPNPPPPEEAEDKGAQTETLADLPEPEDMPKAASPKPVDLPPPVVKTLDNGLRVLVLSERSVPAVTASFNLLSAARNDPDDLAGLASVTAGTLRRGTKRHTGDELAKRIDFHGMSLNESVDHEDSRIQIWALSKDADLAVETLAEVVREPTFPEAEVSEYVARAIAREKINEQDPSTIASRTFAQVLYGENYLGRQTQGTSKTLQAITPAAVREFHQRHYGPNIATLIITGDITPEAAFQLAEKHFGDWTAKAEANITDDPPPATSRQIVVVDRPGAVQSQIRMGQIVPVSRKDPDYPVVRLLSQTFGEAFGARLNRVLRIEMGLTYGARGYFNVDTDAAALFISTFTRTDRTADAIKAAWGEVEKLAAEPIKPDELRQARDSLIGHFQMAMETPAQIAARYWDLIVWGLPENWYSDYLRAVDQVRDPARTVATARRVLAPDRLLVVVVGDGEKIREDLSKIAPVTSRPAEESVGPQVQAR
ncbi:MAG TPA: pitrilysin family protein [Phycisphaerae bacterium]|nr:pitrilysin family protein [Phycisphaerae bacterium]HOL26473.1 pitrilysin family protein [Phycisphaerae bacterium]HPU32827.1 pitrilysin family protein [Phycisphaerae bacterium]HQA45397.1 pitrilysin family protein [Phycisphaerae bacterium]HXK86532.1 pitrilysin family protein [Phycisphaerae bacterium]